MEPVELTIGEPLTLDFVELTFAETGIATDIQQSITTGNVTRITGPEAVEGQQFVYLRGTIKNLAKQEIPVFDFFEGEFNLDDYLYSVTANDCDVITAEGEMEHNVPPLTTYSFTIYAAIPNELADSHSAASFRFGFFDMFENEELAKNRAFEDDPISLCPYYYKLTLK